jgi:uroporphyrinogen decarboxylase
LGRHVIAGRLPEFSWKYINQIVEALAPHTHVIVFGKGCWFALGEMGKSKASALGVDWTCSPRNARYLSGRNITLQVILIRQGCCHQSQPSKMVHQMIDEFGKDKYIVNLGHGILPNIPVDHAKAFIDAVKEYNS